jgi:hypothetical protein
VGANDEVIMTRTIMRERERERERERAVATKSVHFNRVKRLDHEFSNFRDRETKSSYTVMGMQES